MKRLGVTYLRTGLSWADSFRPNALDWFDRQMEALADFDVTVTFCFTPEHRGIAPHHTSPPLVKEEFAEFCAAMIRRYAPGAGASKLELLQAAVSTGGMRAVAREQPLIAPERAAAFLRALATGRLIRARSVAMVVAHPDDETIGAGAQLPRLNGVTMIHVTDGAPRKPHEAERHGFATAAEYAFARARELERVMMLAGIPVADRFCLGLADQEAALHLPRVARAPRPAVPGAGDRDRADPCL